MANLERFAFIATLMVLGLAVISSVWLFAISRRPVDKKAVANAERSRQTPGYLTVILVAISLIALTLSLVARAVITGHGPFSNMYEFAVSFSWGILVMGLFFHWRYHMRMFSGIGAIMAFVLLLYAFTLPSRHVPLVPALQQSLLLTLHVSAAIIAYGTFTIGFGVALLYLIQRHNTISWLPKSETLDDMGYHTVIIGFPFMTLVIVLGALWADIAWGRYWSWDPKETASLVTWLIYAGYLHARVLRGWRGSRTAVLLIIGFAAVVFTFLGNYIFAGLHSYR